MDSGLLVAGMDIVLHGEVLITPSIIEGVGLMKNELVIGRARTTSGPLSTSH